VFIFTQWTLQYLCIWLFYSQFLLCSYCSREHKFYILIKYAGLFSKKYWDGFDFDKVGCFFGKLSVRKVVPTLTSTKQLGDTGFIPVPVGTGRPAGVCSRHYIALHRGACRGALQAGRERRWSLQVPEVWLRLSANIVVKAESVQVRAIGDGQGTAPPFISQGEAVYKCAALF
jgi:hypothetical protein